MATAKTADTKENTVAEAAPGEKEWDYIKFGSYYQDNNSKKTPIEWLVLEKKEDELLLISRYGLDCRLYHHEYVDMTWEKCDLRKWLNNDFLNEAFTSEERKKIKVSSLINNDDDNASKYIVTKGGNATQDRVFCLSRSEARNYFKDDKARRCKATKYAASKNYCWVESDASSTGYGCSYWWLRSSGPANQRAASCVGSGGFWASTCLILIDGVTVRPSLRIIWNE